MFCLFTSTCRPPVKNIININVKQILFIPKRESVWRLASQYFHFVGQIPNYLTHIATYFEGRTVIVLCATLGS